MPGRHFLHIPGPTNVPQRIRNAMAIEQEDMRSAIFPAFTLPLFEDLKKIFKTSSGRVLVFPSSGTGAWEAAISNSLAPGDKVLMSHFGQFSWLWVDMCQRYGLDVHAIELDWGEGVPLDQYAGILKADTNKQIKAVFVTHNETSTGVASDVAAVRHLLNDADHPALLFVDGVSSVASMEFKMDEWGVDFCISGSQKGLMLPTGLGLVCASRKALDIAANHKQYSTYFSFADMIKSNDGGYFPHTPATTLLRGLRESINMLLEEGLDNVFARHKRLGEAVRRAVQAWDLPLVARHKKSYSDTVTAIYVPEGFDGNAVVRHACQRYNLALGTGLGKVAGKAFRIGHIGDLNELMILTPITGAEMTMKDLGIPITLGSGVAAAQEYLRNTSRSDVSAAANF